MSKKLKVMVGVPTMGNIRTELVARLIEDKDDYDNVYFSINTVPHSTARNEVANMFLATGSDVLVFVDADVVPPKGFLKTLRKHFEEGHKIVGGHAPLMRNLNGKNTRIMNFGKEDGLTPYLPPKGEELMEVKNIGGGLMAIHKDVFKDKNVLKPYFDFFFRNEEGTRVLSEEVYFCNKAKMAGFKIMLDPTLECEHYKTYSI